jgi:hypothetical protein
MRIYGAVGPGNSWAQGRRDAKALCAYLSALGCIMWINPPPPALLPPLPLLPSPPPHSLQPWLSHRPALSSSLGCIFNAAQCFVSVNVLGYFVSVKVLRPYRAALGASSMLLSASNNRTDEHDTKKLFRPNFMCACTASTHDIARSDYRTGPSLNLTRLCQLRIACHMRRRIHVI